MQKGRAFRGERRRKMLGVEEGCAFIFIFPRSQLSMKRERMVGAGIILGHLAPVKLLVVIRSILRSAFLANT